MISKERLRKIIYDNTIFNTATDLNTHYDKHNASIQKDVDRAISSGKMAKAESHFIIPEDYDDDMENSIKYMIGDTLTDQLVNNNSHLMDLEELPDGKKYKIQADYKEPIGKGVIYNEYENRLQEIQTSMITVVLRRNRYNETGFDIVTAYPDLTHPTAQPTGRDISDELHNSPTYQNADIVTQARLDCMASGKPLQPSYKHPAYEDPYMYYDVPVKDKDGKPCRCSIKMTNHSLVFRTKNSQNKKIRNPLNKYSPGWSHIDEANLLNDECYEHFKKMFPGFIKYSNFDQCRTQIKTYADAKLQERLKDRELPDTPETSCENFDFENKL